MLQKIRINTMNKSSSIRISERTKKMLEALSLGKESHEQIILRLINLANKISREQGTTLYKKNKALGTKYNRVNEKFIIETNKNEYSIVCVYNDLTIFSMLRQNQLHNLSLDLIQEWEVNLDIVNAKERKGKWGNPRKVVGKELELVEMAVLKQVLEKTFDILLYEIVDEKDYLDIGKWRKMYEKYNLSLESFYNDVEKKLEANNV
ncbi:MAG: hypothetical protein ACOCQG_04975 [Candidatus Nanoarchaeia archaeon]